MDHPDSELLSTAWQFGVDADASAAEIADAIGRLWTSVDHALTPILGHAGVAMLYKRSAYLAGKKFGCLLNLREDPMTAMNSSLLRSELTRCTASEAAAAGSAMLTEFYQLLCSLVGSLLTKSLLQTVWARSHRRPSDQDIPL